MDEVDLGAEADIGDVDGDGVDDLVARDELCLHFLAEETIELRRGVDDDAVVEVDGFGSVEREQRDIDGAEIRAKGYGGERGIAHRELAEAVLGQGGAVVAAVA